MLRMRSGGDPSSEAPLPPEMDQVIAEARAEMDRLVELGGLQNDPLRHPIQALSVHLGALHTLTLNSSRTLAKQVEAARQSINDEDIRRLSQAAANGAERRAAEVARSANRRTVAIATASVLADPLAHVSSATADSRRRGRQPGASGMSETRARRAQHTLACRC